MSVVTEIAMAERETVRALAGELAEVYLLAFAEVGEPPEAASRFRDEQLPKHVGREGFRCAIARHQDRVVGFAYGYTGANGRWWTDRVAQIAPAEVTARWLGGHFEFVELAVDPAVRGQGIGTALHDKLLEGLPHSTALLTTCRNKDLPAPRLYRRLGWRVLVSPLDSESDLYGLALAHRNRS